KSLFREYLESIVVAVLLALLVRTFFLQAFKIPTGSMRPTLVEGDRILVNKVVYGIPIPLTSYRLPEIRRPRRGDLVVFRSPDLPRRDFIKRLVAVGGDEVEIRDLRLWVNGRPLTDPSVFRELVYYNRGPFGELGKPVVIPAGHYFFLGDNSASSRDSRYWGFLPRSQVIGQAFLIYWPPKRIRWLKVTAGSGG
ncbi:MAG: signal peptidase I, partial [Candidatus Omnitrophica bacterium]|nr:signal peptidase I [Candidatus Omnitrophota bacterium]